MTFAPTQLSCPMTRRASNSGFSLIELVIVMLIIGILAALALPNYQRYTARGNRAAAKAFLNDIAQRQASFYADRKRFARTLSELGFVDTTPPGSGTSGSQLGTAAALDENGIIYVAPVAGKSLYQVSLVQNPASNTGATNVRGCQGMTAQPDALSFRQAWAVTAVPINSQATRDMGCSTLCLNGTGRQGASGGDGWQTCWRG